MVFNSPLEHASPESQGLPSSAITDFIVRAEAEQLGLHSFMLLRHGRVLKQMWWRPFAPDVPHILYSLTKSFMSTAAGFAISEGRLSLDDPVLKFFPREAPKNPSEHWRDMRVRHLLSMSGGHDAEPGDELRQIPPRDWVRFLLQTPLPHAPGTHFLYNSIGSHLAAVIVQKVTGQKLVNYLRDRLFRPLGIGRPYWETDPLGRNWGGWGLFLRTDEIARFGQVVLDRGCWQGRQIVPAEWLAQATSKQIDNGTDPNSDWAQGYGFQYWMSRHGFRGDGAFGQFCVVLPEQDAVLVTTASTPDMQAILNAAWETLLPAFRDRPLPEDPAALSELDGVSEDSEIELPAGAYTSPREAELSGRTFRLDANPLGLESLAVERDRTETRLTVALQGRQETVRLGMAGWGQGKAALDYPQSQPVSGAARWTTDDELTAKVIYLLPASTRHFRLCFDAGGVTVYTRLTGTFAPPDEITITGR